MKLNTSPELLIMGCGGHARSLADVALACGFHSLFFVDPRATINEHFCNFPILQEAPKKKWHCALGAGYNVHREQQMREALEQEWIIETFISPLASKGLGAVIGSGSLIAHHAHVGPMSSIGQACIINTAAIVEHDCCIGDFSHVAVNATLAGGVTLGRHVFIGAGAIIRNGLKICDNTIVGAGSTVVKDISEQGVYIGTPAKLLKKL